MTSDIDVNCRLINQQDVWMCVFHDLGKRPRENKCVSVVKNVLMRRSQTPPHSPAIPTVYINASFLPVLPPPPFKAQVRCGVFLRLERRDGRISDRSQREQVFGSSTVFGALSTPSASTSAFGSGDVSGHSGRGSGSQRVPDGGEGQDGKRLQTGKRGSWKQKDGALPRCQSGTRDVLPSCAA